MAKEKKNTLETTDASVKEETKKAKKATKKSNKKGEEKKMGFFAKIGKWFKDLVIEFKHVTWPSRKTVLINTSIVLGTILFASAFVGLLDLGLLELLKFLIGLGQSA